MRRSSAFTSTSYRRYQRRMAGHEQAQITQERRRRGRRYNQVLSPPARAVASLLASPSSDIKQPKQYTGTRQSGVGPVLTCKITPFRPPRRSSRTTSTASSRQLLYSNAKNEATTAITNGMSTNVSDARARATKKNTPFMFTYGSECGHATAHGVLNDLVAIASTKCKDEVGAVKLERPRPSLLI
jgi:hypothetical protein